MADRYYVGGTGNWSDSNHWSTTSGGTGGASVPTSADNVYFDDKSFTEAGQTVTVDATANCKDMDWTGATNSPTLAGSKAISVYGSLAFIGAMTRTLTGYIYLYAASAGKTITTGGTSINILQISGAGGEWTLQDSLTLSNALYIEKGTLKTNGQAVSTANIEFLGSNAKNLILGSTVLTITNALWTNLLGFIIDAGTSTIKITGNSKTFKGGGLTYHNVELNGATPTITGSNTFTDLKIKAGVTCTMTAGTTQTIGTLHSDTEGSAATLSCASGVVTVNNASVQDITATGGATFNAIDSTNVSGNTGWNWLESLKNTSISMGMGMGL